MSRRRFDGPGGASRAEGSTRDTDPLRSYRAQRIRIGFHGSLVVLAVVAVTLFLVGPRDGTIPTTFAVTMLLGAAIGAASLFFLDWDRLSESRMGAWFLYAASVLDVMIIGGGISLTGESHSELFFLYALTTTLFAIIYARRTQILFLGTTVLTYLTVLWATGWDIGAVTLVFRLAVLLAVALLGNFLSSELVRLLEAQFEVSRRLRELDELRTDFMSTVSHELRTPLAAIKGFGVTLGSYWPRIDDEVRTDLIERIGANAQELDDKLTELLDFSLAQRGHVRIRPARCTASELVDPVLEKLDEVLGHHVLEVDIAPGLTVFADPVHFPRVLEHLLANAGKFTAPGTRISLRAREAEGETMLTVADEGPGIAPEERERIFQRFYRVRRGDSSPNGGTGIGLAIVKQLVEAHEGRVWVESEPGTGSTFTVAIPMPPGASPQGVVPAARPAGRWRRPGGIEVAL